MHRPGRYSGSRMLTRTGSGAASALLLLAATLSPGQQPTPPSAPETVATTNPPAQMLDLFASNAKSGQPDPSLTENDLILLDDGKPVLPSSLIQPAQPGIRPAVFWIIVQCVMPGVVNNGSGFLRGFTTDLASGLTRLAPGEAYGVAHWCDDGAASIDLPPSCRLLQLAPALDRVLGPTVNPPNNPFLGENALLHLIGDTISATQAFNPRAMPVLVFLYGDHTAADARKVDDLALRMLAVPATLFVVNNGLADVPPAGFREIPMVLGNLAGRTGGSYFHTPFGNHDPLVFAQALATVVERLHSRYQIAWVPRMSDRQEHPLSVKLTPNARKAHPGLELRFRNSYLASR